MVMHSSSRANQRTQLRDLDQPTVRTLLLARDLLSQVEPREMSQWISSRIP